MGVRELLPAFVTAVAGFVAVGAAVTELASARIAFSLFVGLPAGLVAGFALGAATYVWLGSDDPRRRRHGAALAAFGIAFLAVLFGGVTAGVRNSRALPIAGAAGVLVAVVAYLWGDEPGRGGGVP